MIPFRRVVREMRSGPPIDIVARMESDGSLKKVATFEEWTQKQLEQNKQAERKSKLQKPPKPVASLLITMAELFDEKQEPLALLDLLKAAKLCRPQVEVKNACNNRETADYNNCLMSSNRDSPSMPKAVLAAEGLLSQLARNEEKSHSASV